MHMKCYSLTPLCSGPSGIRPLCFRATVAGRAGTSSAPATMKCSPLFSEADSDLSALKWRTDRYGYARTNCLIGGVYNPSVYAHRMVLSRILGRSLTRLDICDHLNRTKLDNRRENLRLTDIYGNAQNKKGVKPGHLYGTTLHKCGRWQAASNGKYLGLYGSREQAGKVAMRYRVRKLNNP